MILFCITLDGLAEEFFHFASSMIDVCLSCAAADIEGHCNLLHTLLFTP